MNKTNVCVRRVLLNTNVRSVHSHPDMELKTSSSSTTASTTTNNNKDNNNSSNDNNYHSNNENDDKTIGYSNRKSVEFSSLYKVH